MYIENKEGDGIAAMDAIIGNVQFSKTMKTLRYNGQEFQSLTGSGFKANYFDVETGDHYWLSGCRQDGNDGLYRCTVHVDEDIRHDYWVNIRKMPERKNQASFISAGKHQVGRQQPKNQRNKDNI
jgi:hypothetical protein